MVNSEVVSKFADDNWDNCAADNGGGDETRALAGHRTESGYAEGKDIREHDGVEESAKEKATDGGVSSVVTARMRHRTPSAPKVPSNLSSLDLSQRRRSRPMSAPSQWRPEWRRSLVSHGPSQP